jgi:hypothetical protein
MLTFLTIVSITLEIIAIVAILTTAARIVQIIREGK